MTKGNIQKYILSNPNAICDVCGRKRKWSEVVHAYGTGDIAVVISCKDGCADYRHPLNSPPPIIFDAQPVIDARPEGSDTFISQSMNYNWDSNPYVWDDKPSDFSFDPNEDPTWDNA